MKSFSLGLMIILALVFHAEANAQEQTPSKVIRAGMIGLDTSHVPAFARYFQTLKATADQPKIEIVAAYPGGTDFEPSRTRVAKFTDELRKMGIEIVDTIPKLLEKVDAVFLESVDGRIHLQEAAPVLKAGKPLFIDKPAAGSLADTIAIFTLAQKYQTPCFSSSSVRFVAGVQELKNNKALGEIAGAQTWGPCSYQEDTPDMFFYGVHGIEALFTLMGTGCETVSRVQAADADIVTGVWKNGRVGSYRGIRRNKSEFGAVVFGTKAVATNNKYDGYEPLCREIAKFFMTKVAPIKAEETIEIFAFMEAADVSKHQKGASVKIADVLAKARSEAKTKIQKYE